MASPTAYLDAIMTTLDEDTKDLIQGLFSSQTPRALVDLLVRLAADAPAGPPIQPNSPAFLSRYVDTWPERREAAQAELRRLHAKRKRSATPPPSPAKRAKLLPVELPATPGPAAPDPDDAPVFTLHALSVSSPMRKKLDIALHQRSIRLGDASFALSALKRAFLLPTRGKSKPHWTVVLMSSDQAVKTVKGAHTEGFQIIFGVDAEPTTAFASTAHPAAKETHAKNSPTRPVLLEFLRRLPCPVLEPSAEVFAPASGGGLGIPAYRGAKEGTLWFLDAGVLGENKPCEFWALSDIDDADDALRLQSATGRTCTVFLRRKGLVDGDEGEVYEGEETDFGMVEGREQDGIRQWVRRYRGSFGKEAAPAGVASTSRGEPEPAGTNGVAPMLDDDDDDSDFGVTSEDSDGGSPTSASDSDESDAGSGGEAQGSGSEEDSDAEGEGDSSGDEEEDEAEDAPLDPARHPLMRAGAMPKMNKAAMDMAVGMVVDELIGGHEVEQDGEEDELDD